ncbi:DUF599 domain-containing protein [Hirschia litorea]|uniref:DUF599 domain-containing protein n=2 Tax=Hirschia litorea TaxID=1199156 RepID=A0ABW2IHW3_9PROT
MSIYDGAALVWFLLVWRVFAWLTDHSKWKTETLSFAMHEERRRWMRIMAEREVRILDGNIISGLQQSTSFFASTSLLAIGGGFGLLTAAEDFHVALEQSILHISPTPEMFYLKIIVLMCMYAYAFFKFGWSYRLFNYCAVMMAATPELGQPKSIENAEAAGDMNIEASKQFNYGLRSFFMAMPVLAWFVSPLAFAISATLVVLALAHRQFFSEPRRIARRLLDINVNLD